MAGNGAHTCTYIVYVMLLRGEVVCSENGQKSSTAAAAAGGEN